MLLPKNEEENSVIFLLKGGGVLNFNPPGISSKTANSIMNLGVVSETVFALDSLETLTKCWQVSVWSTVETFINISPGKSLMQSKV